MSYSLCCKTAKLRQINLLKSKAQKTKTTDYFYVNKKEHPFYSLLTNPPHFYSPLAPMASCSTYERERKRWRRRIWQALAWLMAFYPVVLLFYSFVCINLIKMFREYSIPFPLTRQTTHWLESSPHNSLSSVYHFHNTKFSEKVHIMKFIGSATHNFLRMNHLFMEHEIARTQRPFPAPNFIIWK